MTATGSLEQRLKNLAGDKQSSLIKREHKKVCKLMVVVETLKNKSVKVIIESVRESIDHVFAL